jgi:hypothetical protein
MLSYGLRRYLNHKRAQITRTDLIILTYRMKQWQFLRKFLVTTYHLATVMWRPTNLDNLTGRYTSQARTRML